jgi:hypothetical protein
MKRSFAVLFTFSLCASALANDPWADRVIQYSPGSGANTAYTDPSRALGSPTRVTGEASGFAGATTPFNSPFESDELMQVASGGFVVLAFDEPVTDDPQNPFGIDLLVFGNSFFFDPNNFTSPTAQLLSSDAGTIEVSSDGQTWFTITGVEADGLFPTLGYVDVTDPYSSPAGNIATDFTKPVNPSLAWTGLDLTQLVTAYDGSGGGAGVDLASVGLSSISFVRLSVASGAAAIEIDALSDVSPIPTPSAHVILACSLLLASKRRRA